MIVKTIFSKIGFFLKKSTTIFKTLGFLLLIGFPTGILGYYFLYIETRYISNMSINQDLSFIRFNSSLWNVPSFQSTDFAFEIETYGMDNPYRKNVTYSVNYYNMGVTDWFKANTTEWGEWGYSFHHLYGQMDGAGIMHYGKYPTPPQTKLEAYAYMQQYILNRTKYLNNNTRPWLSFNGHYPYHHYAGAWGFDIIGSEIGENIDCYQLNLAFNHGAAVQYHLPWFVDVSAWHSGTITDANSPSWWGESGGAQYGHSLSLFRRTYVMSYMAGTSRLIAEGGFGNLFYRDSADENGLMQLTPLGETARDFVHLTKTHPNRGISYKPIGIVLDELHGTIGFDSRNPKAFYAIPYNQGDWMSYNLFNLIYPNCFKSPENEIGCLINNEFGDIFDIIMQNASAEVLASYPCLLLSGDIHFREDEASKLVQYVSNGGNLIVNSAYFDALNMELAQILPNFKLSQNDDNPIHIIPFPNFHGGNFILYGGDYSTQWIAPILREILPKLLPFTITTFNSMGLQEGPFGASRDIEFMLNRNERGWILTLINNDGITKTPKEPPQIDILQRKTVKISPNAWFVQTPTENTGLLEVKEWTSEKTLWSKYPGNTFNSLTYSIAPGDLAIFEFIYEDE